MRHTWLAWGAFLLWLTALCPVPMPALPPCCAPMSASAAHAAPAKAMPCCPPRAALSAVRACCRGASSAALRPASARPSPPLVAYATVPDASPRYWPPVAISRRLPSPAEAVPFPPPRGPCRPRAPPVLS